MTLLLFSLGLVFLVVGAELLVRGASSLAAALGMSPLVIGLTVVAAGTSAPELAVSLQGALGGQADLAIGNVVGSNIANVLVILGLSALILPLVVHQQLVRIEVPLVVALSACVWLFALDGGIGRLEGIGLVLVGVGYTIYAVRKSRKESREVKEEYAAALPAPGAEKSVPLQALLIVIGLVLLVLGSRWVADAAAAFALALGMSTLAVSLTVVAVGTSLPEIATSLLATYRGQRDIAVGNVVGSNLFNLAFVLGLSAGIAPEGVAVARSAIVVDLPVMIAVTAACLPIFFTGHLIARWEGGLFLAFYAAYTGHLLFAAQRSAWAGRLETVMLAFVVPLSAVTLLVLAVREWRQKKAAAAPESPS